MTACDVTERSGSRTLDAATCALFIKRARFDPATDAAGMPSAGEYRAATAWGVETHQPSTNIAVPLQVAAMPADYRSPVKATLLFDPGGRVSACEITATSGSAAADRAACAYIRQQLVITAPKSLGGVPAAAVRYLTATLATGPLSPATGRSDVVARRISKKRE